MILKYAMERDFKKDFKINIVGISLELRGYRCKWEESHVTAVTIADEKNPGSTQFMYCRVTGRH